MDKNFYISLKGIYWKTTLIYIFPYIVKVKNLCFTNGLKLKRYYTLQSPFFSLLILFCQKKLSLVCLLTYLDSIKMHLRELVIKYKNLCLFVYCSFNIRKVESQQNCNHLFQNSNKRSWNDWKHLIKTITAVLVSKRGSFIRQNMPWNSWISPMNYLCRVIVKRLKIKFPVLDTETVRIIVLF